jgi:hypothetical protein
MASSAATFCLLYLVLYVVCDCFETMYLQLKHKGDVSLQKKVKSVSKLCVYYYYYYYLIFMSSSVVYVSDLVIVTLTNYLVLYCVMG